MSMGNGRYDCEECCRRLEALLAEVRGMKLAQKAVLSKKEVQEYTGLGLTFINESAREGRMPCSFVGRGKQRYMMFFEREKVERYLLQNDNGWTGNNETDRPEDYGNEENGLRAGDAEGDALLPDRWQ